LIALRSEGSDTRATSRLFSIGWLCPVYLFGDDLFGAGNVSQREMHKFKQESKQAGKGTFAYAWVLDAHDEERKRGITVDVAVNNFDSLHRHITLLDAPGHRDFIPNMIAGAAQADVAVLVVDASPNGFEQGFENGGQTKEHAILVRSLGVTELVVAVNKMDETGWSQARFFEIHALLLDFLVQLGFKAKSLTFVPVSGYSGENLIASTEGALQSWYSQIAPESEALSAGLTLEGAIDRLTPPERMVDRALRMSVADSFKGQGMSVTLSTCICHSASCPFIFM
jgi:elongation factor 1 alpha-like protein